MIPSSVFTSAKPEKYVFNQENDYDDEVDDNAGICKNGSLPRLFWSIVNPVNIIATLAHHYSTLRIKVRTTMIFTVSFLKFTIGCIKVHKDHFKTNRRTEVSQDF